MEAEVLGRRRGEPGRFRWQHPIADGAWLPELWEVGQVINDRTLTRPRKAGPGTWDLSWRLVEVRSRRRTTAAELPLGTLEILEGGVPTGPAGVVWDGELPDPDAASESLPMAWLAAGEGGALLLLLGGALAQGRRRRR